MTTQEKRDIVKDLKKIKSKLYYNEKIEEEDIISLTVLIKILEREIKREKQKQ